MAESNFRGPVVGMGALEDNSSSPFDGPSGLFYQGIGVLDPRANPYPKDGVTPGRAPAFLLAPFFVITDNIPSTISSGIIVTTAQSAVTAQAFTLNTTSAGGSAAGVPSWTYGIPIIPLGTTTVTTVGAIDFGFTTGTTAANSSTVVVVDSTMFKVGRWYCIGGAGNTGNTTSILTQCTVIVNGTTINVSPVTPGALSHAPIGNTNLQNDLLPPAANFGPAAASASATQPYQRGGLGLWFDPLEGLCRNITVKGNTTNATASFLVNGFDMYGAAMTELITASGTTTVGGKKAFKYVTVVSTNATSVTGTYNVGVGDIFGINLRADRFEAVTVVWNGLPLTANAGFTAAFSTASPSTNTSADVRGTLSVAAFTAFNAAASNGTGRLFVGIDMPLMNVLNAAAGSTSATSMFGAAQA